MVRLPPAGHGVAGVGGEAGEARLELRRIGHHRPEIRSEVERDRNGLAEQPVEQLGRAGDQLVNVDAARLQRQATREGEEPARQIGAAQRRIARLAGKLENLRPDLLAVAQEVEIADDNAEQIGEIMRQPAGEVAGRLRLLRLARAAARSGITLVSACWASGLPISLIPRRS